jgi:hypothetical protein
MDGDDTDDQDDDDGDGGVSGEDDGSDEEESDAADAAAAAAEAAAAAKFPYGAGWWRAPAPGSALDPWPRRADAWAPAGSRVRVMALPGSLAQYVGAPPPWSLCE